MRITLASSSPYRQALLRQIHLPFSAVKPNIDESILQSRPLPPGEIAAELAALKGEDVQKKFPHDLIIASDQVAHFNGEILSKPGSPSNAEAQLRRLQGQRHTLSTAMWIRHPELGVKTHLDETRLTLRRLSDEEISAYVKIDNPVDCAGAYKIESAGICLIEQLDTQDQTAIVGLPLLALCRILREWRLPTPFLWPKEI